MACIAMFRAQTAAADLHAGTSVRGGDLTAEVPERPEVVPIGCRSELREGSLTPAPEARPPFKVPV
ncbi:MAG: hypothetical protein HYY16_04500 [Planctomycetes bacterium]|nr:hypothetical protein [Planctomycetota bacterium]